MRKTKLAIFLAVISLMFFGMAGMASAATYYVDSASGNDGSSGLSPETAWQSLVKVNSSSFSPGSSILFKKGGVWRGQIKLVSGATGQTITYGSYGNAIEKPLILGSINKSNTSDWVQESGNIWKSSSAFETDVGNIIFDHEASVGKKKWDISSLTAQGDYWLDKSTKILYVYSTGNPAIFYSDIECALRKHIIDQDDVSYVTVDGLALKYGGAHGVGGGKTHHLTIRNMDISYIGGGDQNGDGSNVRYGNGIEFWSQAHDNLVERNKIWEVYDACLSNQNTGPNTMQYNITYKNNVMWNCGLASFEYWNRPASSQTNNIRFENNTAVNAGFGWGEQRPDPGGAHILIGNNEAAASSVYIRNNVFSQAKYALFVITETNWTGAGMISDYNCWYQSDSATKMAELYSASVQTGLFTVAQFNNYQSFTGNDANSLVTNPSFLNPSQFDFRLAAGSLCADRGVDTGITDDFYGNIRPENTGFDLGAFEYVSFVPDTTLPTVSLTAPPSGATVSGSTTLSVAAADNMGVQKVDFYRDANILLGTDTTSPYSFAWNTTAVSNGTHTFFARAYDASGNQATTFSRSVTVNNTVIDSTPPTSPTAVKTTTTLSSQVTLSWSPSVDDISVTGYRIYRNNTQVGISTTTTYTDTGLSSSTTYTYTIRAVDTAGNLSGASAPITVTTPAVNETSNIITAKGVVSVTVVASSNAQVTKVEFYQDTQTTPFALTISAPFVAQWNTTSMANGNHVVRAQIYFADGTVTTSRITLNMQN